MKRDFTSLQGRQFDLLVCGGGIYGAWAAYDAALRGLNVAIVEQGDWASGTSSASTKLIHGGLRYLETYDFALVRKALSERNMLIEAAPHRVWPLRFGVPVYGDSRVGRLRLKAGLMLYDLLGSHPTHEMAHRYLDRAAFAGHFPPLDEAQLEGGFTYADAQTDDARLVLELIAGAISAGAVCVNYCRLVGLIETEGRAVGATVEDRLGGGRAEVLAKRIVNTTGQWMAESDAGKWCRLAKGVHLVMPDLGLKEAVLLTAKSDGRVFFIIPWYGATLLGTTDTEYRGDPDHVAVETQDIAYLLAAANRYLKTSWSEQDIMGGFAGVRVLKQEGTSTSASAPSSLSRDWELKTGGNGVLYSVGGKITSAREDAARIVDRVCGQIGIEVPSQTRGRAFPWKPDGDFGVWSTEAIEQAKRMGIDGESALWLIRRHGKRVADIFRSTESDTGLAARIVPQLPFVHADFLFCAQNEMAVHLDDLLRRRMPLLILANLTKDQLQRLAAAAASVMGWDDAAIEREVERIVARREPAFQTMHAAPAEGRPSL